MSERALTIAVEGTGGVSAICTRPPRRAVAYDRLVIYAPGAGSNLADPFGACLAGRLADAGISTLRFQFPYTEAHRRLPDRNPVLESTWRGAIEAGRAMAEQLIVGGRSMGGRIASQVVAQGVSVSALALFAYPLHPPGKPEQRRDAHLASISVPALFCSGTRDAFATPAELTRAARLAPRSSLHFLEGADHGFKIAKASGRTQQEVWEEACVALLAFLQENHGG